MRSGSPFGDRRGNERSRTTCSRIREPAYQTDQTCEQILARGRRGMRGLLIGAFPATSAPGLLHLRTLLCSTDQLEISLLMLVAPPPVSAAGSGRSGVTSKRTFCSNIARPRSDTSRGTPSFFQSDEHPTPTPLHRPTSSRNQSVDR
jgi:hypothetical protein